jgi:hypothetical protein
MVTTTFTASTDAGPTYKVSDFIKNPTLIQSVVTRILDKQFIADAILRSVPGPPGGVVKYRESEPMFAQGLELIAEYGEIPVAQGADGVPQAVFTAKGGGAILISEEMRTRNDVDLFNKRIKQVTNGMVLFWDTRFMNAVWAAQTSGAIPAQAVPLAWTDTTAKVRFDIAKARETVMSQVDANGNEYAFNPDTIVLNPLRASALTYNDDVAKVFQGNLADKSLLYAGDEGREIGGLRILKSWRVPANKAIVTERKTMGFIADERALRTTPMYEQRERETHRSDTTRMSAVGIDAPKSAVILTGV